MDLSPFWISLKVALTATVISFLLGTYIAFRMKGNLTKGSQLFDIILNLPLVLPPTVAGLLLLMIFGKKGLLGKTLLQLGYQIIFTKEGAVLAAAFVAFPLMYRCAKSAFAQVDQKLIEAGRTLGMSEYAIFIKIILPLSLPGIVSGVILSFARALGEFGATLIVAGNIPGVTQTMPLAIYMNLQSGNYQFALLWSGILIAFSFFMMLLIKCITHRFRGGIAAYR
ncbi:molybdate ABC transporter permease subunit [Variimorphobacter saccharofermentans]|jgi:molybdate transport system permease protein|nr:molybdate ABC transporter permease subunit [Variimorphobacter saccharofermentans]